MSQRAKKRQSATPPPRRSRGLVIAGIVAGCLVLILLIAAAVAVSTRSSGATATAPSSGVGKAVQAPGPVDIVLTDYSVSGGNDASQPKTGHEYLVTHWLITNRGASPLKIRPADFVAISGGQSLPAETGVKLGGTSLLTLSIPPSRAERGDLVFQVKTADPAARVEYRSGGYTAQWNTPG